MSRQLNPWAWVALFEAIISSQLSAKRISDLGPASDRLAISGTDVVGYLAARNLPPTPDIRIAASVAEPILGISDVAIAALAGPGRLSRSKEGYSLVELDAFRFEHVFPSEVRRWFDGSNTMFCDTMRGAGFTPATIAYKVNIWRRADVEAVFPESAKMKYLLF